MSLGKLFTTIFVSLFLSGNVFAEGSKFDRFATDVETTAQLRDDVGLTPASIPFIIAAPGVISKFQLDHNTETLNADRTILITDKPIQFLDANGADRNITLPVEASSTDLVFVITNVSNGAGEDLVIRDDTPTTLITVGPGQGATVSCDGTSWKTPNAKGIYYDGISDIVIVSKGASSCSVDAATVFVLESNSHSFVQFNTPNTRTSGFLFGDPESSAAGQFKYDHATDRLQFFSRDTMAFGSAITGEVPIKMFNGFLLELQKESADAEETISVYHDTEATAPIITLRKADNNATAPALVDDNAVLGRINFKGYDGSGWHTGAKIEARVDGTPSDGADMPAELVFATTPEASGSSTEWMTLMPSGQLKMAESSDPAALADHVFFYGKDVAGTGEAFAADAAANAAQLTPHNFTLFEPDATEVYPWSYYAENKALGIKINVDMTGMIRAVEGLTGKTFIYTQNIAKEVDLEKVYKDKWIADYIKAGIQKAEFTKEQALETVQVDADKWYETEIVDPKTGKVKITKARKKIGEKITGYEFVDNEVRAKVEILWEIEKINKSQIKKNVEFDETDGKFYSTTKPTKAQAITAAETGFVFNPPKWLGDRLEKMK